MRSQWQDDLLLYLLMQISQIGGAGAGLMLAWLTIMPSNLSDDSSLDVPEAWVPVNCPLSTTKACITDGNRDRAAIMQQVVMTFLFILSICIVKSSASPTKDPFLASCWIAFTLFGLINMASVTGGANYNPAVGIALSIYSSMEASIVQQDSNTRYWYVYVFMPYLGGALAGLLTKMHLKFSGNKTGYNSING